MLVGGASDMGQSGMTHANTEPQVSPVENFSRGFWGAAGALAFYAVTEAVKYLFSGSNKKDDKDKNDKDARHSYSGSVGSISPMGGYSF